MKIALIIACALIVLGLVIGIIGLALIGFNFKEMSTVKTVENTYTVAQPFSHVRISSSIGSLEIRPATDGVCRLECVETAKLYYTHTLENDTLCVTLTNNMRWFDYIGINTASARAVLYLPDAAYASLCVENSTGSTKVENGLTFGSVMLRGSTGALSFSADVTETLDVTGSTGSVTLENTTVGGDLTLKSSTGSVTLCNVTVGGKLVMETGTGSAKLKNVHCKTLTTTHGSGSTTLTDVVASERIDVTGSTGSVTLARIDAPTIKIRTETGSVRGSLRGEKVVLATSKTGSIDVPRGTQGGICEIETSTGSIHITIE